MTDTSPTPAHIPPANVTEFQNTTEQKFADNIVSRNAASESDWLLTHFGIYTPHNLATGQSISPDLLRDYQEYIITTILNVTGDDVIAEIEPLDLFSTHAYITNYNNTHELQLCDVCAYTTGHAIVELDANNVDMYHNYDNTTISHIHKYLRSKYRNSSNISTPLIELLNLQAAHTEYDGRNVPALTALLNGVLLHSNYTYLSTHDLHKFAASYGVAVSIPMKIMQQVTDIQRGLFRQCVLRNLVQNIEPGDNTTVVLLHQLSTNIEQSTK